MNRDEMRKQIKKLREKKANRVQTTPPKTEVKKGVVKTDSFSTKKSSLNQVKSAESANNKRDKLAAKRRDIEIQRQAYKKSGGGCGGCSRRIGQ